MAKTDKNIDLSAIYISTDSCTGAPSVFENWEDVLEMYKNLGWTSDPAEDGIIPIDDYIVQQHGCGVRLDVDDWLDMLRENDEGGALYEFDSNALKSAIALILAERI